MQLLVPIYAPKRRFWNALQFEVHGPQANIWEVRSNIRERIFKALFKYVSNRFGLRSFEKCFENSFPSACSAFQNLRLGSIKYQTFLLWRTKKSRFQPLFSGMKTLDKNIDKKNKQ
jgi:hypothetical protein